VPRSLLFLPKLSNRSRKTKRITLGRRIRDSVLSTCDVHDPKKHLRNYLKRNLSLLLIPDSLSKSGISSLGVDREIEE